MTTTPLMQTPTQNINTRPKPTPSRPQASRVQNHIEFLIYPSMKLVSFLSKMNLPNPNPSPPSPAWQWPSCGDTKTLSLRAPAGDDMLTPSEMEPSSGDPVEKMVIRGLSSERLLFNEPGETSSILETRSTTVKTEAEADADADADADAHADADDAVPYKAVSMDSQDPCGDFRRSMEEMVEAHGLKDWESLEELLGCYLKVNAKSNHGYIVGAFVDLLVSLSLQLVGDQSSSSSASSSKSFTISPSSDLPSSPLSLPCLSQLLDQEND